MIGCEQLGIIPPDLRLVVADHSALHRFADEWEQQHGPDVRVRIDIHWVLEALHGTGISYIELAVLAGIYSKLGAKEALRITRSEIWRRALGYKSARVFKDETGGYVSAFTERQVRTIIDRLHTRKFFARITFARRETYYSNRLSAEQLAEYVFAAKTRRYAARRARSNADARLTKLIQAERRRLAAPDATDNASDPPL